MSINSTPYAEIMEINSGEFEYKIAEDWKKIVAPGVFEVPANSNLKLKSLHWLITVH